MNSQEKSWDDLDDKIVDAITCEGAYLWNYDQRKAVRELIEAEASRRAKDAEELGAYMAASSILTEMAPLMVHRLERGFPEMTGEVIGNVYEQVKKEMKPYQDKRQSLKEKES